MNGMIVELSSHALTYEVVSSEAERSADVLRSPVFVHRIDSVCPVLANDATVYEISETPQLVRLLQFPAQNNR